MGPEDVKARALRLGDLRPVETDEEKEHSQLAPGLFAELKEEIKAIMAFEKSFCARCDRKVTNPQYKSVQGEKKVVFCGFNCFDKHPFKTNKK